MSAVSPEPILIAVDGSAGDADALMLGRRFAEALDAPVVVAHAHPYQSVGDLLGDEEPEQLLRSLVEGVSDQAADQLGGTKVVMRLLSDRSPARALHRLASDEQAAMIVVGASERGRVGLIRPGSTAERIVQGSPCPVAVAPSGYATREAGTLERIGSASTRSHRRRQRWRARPRWRSRRTPAYGSSRSSSRSRSGTSSRHKRRT